MQIARVFARLLVVFTMMAVTTAGAAAETITSKTFTYFSIGGRTAAELDAQLSSRGPLMKTTGARHPGATKIKFGGTVTYVERGGRCAVGAAKVTLSANIILPKWKNRKRATKDLALIWDTLSSDIKRHEERHAEIARSHARQMESTFMKLKPEADCERMQATVGRKSLEAIEQHDKDQARFDRTEAKNFEKRMIRLMENRLKGRTKDKS